MSEPSSAQLARLLYILPVAARGDGVSLVELARALGEEPRTVVHELEQAMTRTFYHPAGSVDAFTITIEQARVRVHAPAEFQRPARLNVREALALGLGLRALAAEADEPRRAALLDLAQRLERELQAPEHPLQPNARAQRANPVEPDPPAPPLHVDLEPDDHVGTLADAINQHRICTLEYLKPLARSSATRRVAPLLLVYDRGLWYVHAYDQDQNESRLFRLDRVLNVRVESEQFDRSSLPASADVLRTRGFAFHGDEAETKVRVRYSPRIARWLAENVNAALENDGALILTHHVADLDWLVRHVLQYGEDAEVLTPRAAREHVRDSARTLAQS
ncbi:MAG: helix-turn-helix transcriptional regulator [Longimicrobiales bacterium]